MRYKYTNFYEVSMAKDKLSENNHWDHIHKNKSIWFLNFWNIFEWLQNYMYFDIIKKYVISEHKSIFEIWCAPWNYLIRFYKKFWLIPNWIEYTLSWVEKTNNNFTNSHINWNIIFWDFFDKNFIVENTEKYDIVYSLWFIEHFENIENVIQNHFKLAKKWWLFVISLPNLRYINNLFTENKILEIHNLKIMDLDIIKKYFHKYNDYFIIKIQYLIKLD